MSRTMHLACRTCKEHIWIGQNNAFYSGMPEVMEALRVFLNKHKTEQEWMYENFVIHEMIYTPELSEEGWTEVDTDEYKDK